jgi:hypothetical protein
MTEPEMIWHDSGQIYYQTTDEEVHADRQAAIEWQTHRDAEQRLAEILEPHVDDETSMHVGTALVMHADEVIELLKVLRLEDGE